MYIIRMRSPREGAGHTAYPDPGGAGTPILGGQSEANSGDFPEVANRY